MTEPKKSEDDKDYRAFIKIIKKYEIMPYYEPNSQLYLSMYIGSYVQKLFKGERIKDKGHSYWTIIYNKEKLKVRHLSSTIGVDEVGEICWRYKTDCDKSIDAIILTAFDYIEYLSPIHLWFIPVADITDLVEELFNIMEEKKYSIFKNRLVIRQDERVIEIMKKYELMGKLQKLDDIINLVREVLKKKSKDNIFRMIIAKKSEMYFKTGIKFSNKEIVESAIRYGINNIDENILKRCDKNDNKSKTNNIRQFR